MARYVGRFAPSPTGPLHAGSLVAALASYLDAKAHGGSWHVRIEDTDTQRCVPGVDHHILAQLHACGLRWDGPVWWQSIRKDAYQTWLAELRRSNRAYDCSCTRQDIERALQNQEKPRVRHEERVYPGTCRVGLAGRAPRAVRLLCREPDGSDATINWDDRRLGQMQQNVSQAVGDFVLWRADGQWAYQMAVVVDDAAMGITHVVRGEDLADNTPRQIYLQQQLGLATPRYLHTPLIVGPDGRKLSKQHGAPAIDASSPLEALRQAGHALGICPQADDLDSWLARACEQWGAHWVA